MGRRRFALLAGVLVTLNLVLWLAPQGLALRQIVISKLFGPKLIRAEVIDRAPGGTTTDWRFDRGIIVSVTATELTLNEADGYPQTIQLGTSTRVVVGHRNHRLPLLSLTPGWRVLVTWPAPDGPADLVVVESRSKAKGGGSSSGQSNGSSSGQSQSSRTPAFHLS